LIAAAPIAAATEEMRLVIPPWGCVLLLGVGTVYLVLGSRWSRLLTVLSMTFLGCVLGLVASQWVPMAQPLVIAAGGVLVGGLAALFRDVAQAVLTSLVLGTVLMVLAGLVVGDEGFTSYLAVNLSDTSYSTQWSAPNLAHDAVLAAFLTGLLAGAAVGLGYPRVSRRLTAAGQGAALLIVGVTELFGAWRSPAQPSLASQYPLTLTACWVCLTVIGMRIEQAVERLDEPLGGDEGDGRQQGV